jgi:hypothetical protein
MANDETHPAGSEVTHNERPQQDLSLLEKVERMLRVERALTAAIDRVEPWLDSRNRKPHHPSSEGNHGRWRRVRPIPRSMEEAEKVLAYARFLANKTSAPPGWNPQAPVVGFSTPNPLPHQLRGGSLAALQLERARTKQRNKLARKRRRRQLEQQTKQSATKVVGDPAAKAPQEEEEEEDNDAPSRDPKRRDVLAHQHQHDGSTAGAAAPLRDPSSSRRQQPQVPPPRPAADVSMNLSSESSSEDEDDD